MGGWTKMKLMLFSTQVEVVVELKLELSLAILITDKENKDFLFFSIHMKYFLKSLLFLLKLNARIFPLL